jgi:nitrous oxide reductase
VSGGNSTNPTANPQDFTLPYCRLVLVPFVSGAGVLVITALDRAHGFKIDDFQIDRKLPKGEAVTIDFTADRSGTFPIQCSEFCGLGHKKMKGELIIE